MKKIISSIIIGYLSMVWLPAFSQSFREEVMTFRANYKQEFASSARSPMPESDLEYLRFYEPDSSFLVIAEYKASPSSKPFDIPTYSGIKKEFIKYGDLSFSLHGKSYQLEVYRNLALQNLPIYKNHLFVPFKDLTNTYETYGGGRYIDLSTTEIQNSRVTLDFNKAYNPYCAYSDGFNCPIPPKENHLPVRIEAGEQNFGKEH